MKAFYDTSIRHYNRNCKKPLSFFLVSDIHFSPKLPNSTLNRILKSAKSKKPDYILIPGDLVDNLDTIYHASEEKRLLSWLERLGKVAPTLISLGNHDFYNYDPNQKAKFFARFSWQIGDPIPLINQINKINNVQVIDNSHYEDDRVYIFGFTQSPSYFQFDNPNRKNAENTDIIISDLSNLPKNEYSKLPKNKVKIALAHSPFRLFEPEVAEFFQEFNYIVSGHTHNGAVPPIIHDFWRSDRGIFAPGNTEFFPHFSRSGLYGKNIICGAVDTISTSAHGLRIFNIFYPINIATLQLTNNKIYERKANIKHKYYL